MLECYSIIKKSIPILVVEVENADSLSEIIESESSEWEDFVFVTPKRTRKTNRKFLFSVSNKKSHQTKQGNSL